MRMMGGLTAFGCGIDGEARAGAAPRFTVRRLTSAVIAAGLFAVAAPASAGGRQPIDITPDNVELTNAGALDFPVDLSKLNLPGGAPQEMQVKLWFDAEGRVVGCDPVKGDAANAATLCGQGMAHGRLSLMPGFGEPIRRGFIVVSITVTPSRTYQLEPERPIAFSGAGTGLAMNLVLGPQPDGGGARHCSVNFGGFLPGTQDRGTLSDAAQAAICTAFNERETKGEMPCPTFSAPPTVRWTGFECHVAARPGAFTTSVRHQASAVLQYVHADLRYPPDDSAPAERLNPADGDMVVPPGGANYPPLLVRWGVQGRVQALLGVKSDGTITTCRPLESSGTAALDNATCSMFVRRAHYRFATPPSYMGLRFAKATVNWKLPQ